MKTPPNPSTALHVKTEVAPSTFTYTYIMGNGDKTTIDPKNHNEYMYIYACDVPLITDSGYMGNVCSFDANGRSDGGVYYMIGTGSYRSFRREDPLPGQTVSFENTVIPFGYPALHPITGDTYLTCYFNIVQDGAMTKEKGVYVYDLEAGDMRVIADTTASANSLPSGRKWTDFSTNVAVSESGAFFKGTYADGQGIFKYNAGELVELVGNPSSTSVPGQTGQVFTNYRGVTANASTVLFVGEWANSQGVYAYDLATGALKAIIESGAAAPDGGTFQAFAVEPPNGIFGSSMVVNPLGDIVLVATYLVGEQEYQGVFLLKSADGYTPALIMRSGTDDPRLLGRVITSFNTVAINKRSEIAFTVANNDDPVPYQGLVFYRNAVEGLRSVFKPGDTCVSDLKFPSSQYKTTKQSGMIFGSQGLDSAPIPRAFFRSMYTVETVSEDGQTTEAQYATMALATLNPVLVREGVPTTTP